MRFPTFKHPVTGIAVPVGALKTENSCGVGEFLDLIPFSDFCKKTGVDLIQLLPVNDTGTESSPYSALSAFALHPIYLRLQELPEARPFIAEIEGLATRYEYRDRFCYREIRENKLALLRLMYNVNEKEIVTNGDLDAWIRENPWIAEYAVFMNLKRRNFEASWKCWDKLQKPSHSEIAARWEDPAKRSDHLFFAWIQMCLDRQFRRAVSECESRGIAVKGDIPIMMNEDSCDAWANPEFFRDDLRAGSPPDASNALGQNWGFPIYNWDNLRATGYSWWKNRLKQSARYYHAYRIDHILGFFRIWSIPYGEWSGYLGWTTPHTPTTQQELAERGFTGDRLRWIVQPHVPTSVVEWANGGDYLGAHGAMRQVMNRIGTEELWLFKDEIRHEADIRATSLPDAIKDALVGAWRNRLVLRTGRDALGSTLYAPTWGYRETTAWASFSDEERSNLEKLFSGKAAEDAELWKAQAETILGELTKSVDMLPCAEDLGSVPDIVPGVLAELGILGLKVFRWERKWAEQGQPYKALDQYAENSVATTSVHDSSTLRGWWEQEDGSQQFLSTWPPESYGYPEGTTDRFRARYTPEVAEYALKRLASATSSLFVVPIQDFLALSPDYYRLSPDEERVNVPGSVNDFNWTYRLPETIEQLERNDSLVAAMREVLKDRRERATKKRN